MLNYLKNCQLIIFVTVCTLIILGPSIISNIVQLKSLTSEANARESFTAKDILQPKYNSSSCTNYNPNRNIGGCIGSWIGFGITIAICLFLFNIPIIGWIAGLFILGAAASVMFDGYHGEPAAIEQCCSTSI